MSRAIINDYKLKTVKSLIEPGTAPHAGIAGIAAAVSVRVNLPLASDSSSSKDRTK
jgi:hypothetical protein